MQQMNRRLNRAGLSTLVSALLSARVGRPLAVRVERGSKYQPHQGARECARRVRQAAGK